MKDLVLDFVTRMTGGNEPVAALCRQTMQGLEEEGDVCIELDADGEALLRTAPDAVAFGADRAKAVKRPFVPSNKPDLPCLPLKTLPPSRITDADRLKPGEYNFYV